ncbi:energy transducer TonB [Flavobacterium agricola]|uniref:Energy transducer TonB n=1 Tax=Flavobacterium agricola TaxID=2870839 RepID=A0ABY6LYV5_9FLAO|nr:energy transducer TonB [Flavobacterium agricola]UYW01466.1 energy transducer TonB [Flavobacterium agricola]
MDSNTNSNTKRKSLGLTVLVYSVFLLLLFFIRFWPPSDAVLNQLGQGGGGGGVTVNFGDSDFGRGKNFNSQVLDISTTVTAVATPTNTVENILSSEVSDQTDYVVANTPTKIEKKETKVEVTKPVVETPQKPKVAESTNSALSNLLGGNTSGGDGNDNVAGNKGNLNGSLSSSDYYGTGGSGGGTGGGHGTGSGTGTGSGIGPGSGGGSGGGAGYSLGNRKVLNKPEPKYICNESGRIVVEITVDRSGKTINAVPGVKGSTNLAKCLLDQAKIAAMATKWQSSPDAPAVQTGQIIYNFSLN